MSFTGTETKTYTVADIRKVVANFGADFAMKAQATGLRTHDQVVESVYDLRIFAELGYLEGITLILKDAAGNQIRGTKYFVSTNAVGWQSDRPGNNLWPRTPGGSLTVIATLSSDWWAKTVTEKQRFIDTYSLHGGWGQTSEDTTLSGLVASQGQRYASNGWGMNRMNYG